MRIKLLLLLLLAASGLAEATALDKLRLKLARFQPFLVDFRQVVVHNGVQEADESGEIRFLDPENQLWEYRDPEKKLFLLLNGHYQFYIIEEKQLLRGRVSEIQANIFNLLLDREERGLRVREKGSTITIELEEDDLRVTLRVVVDKSELPVSVSHVQDNGIVTEYHFSNYRRRETLTAADLALQIPADVEIIED